MENHALRSAPICLDEPSDDPCSPSARVGAIKLSTRRRLAARLEVARRHLEENDDREVALDELAATAGVSKYHLARLFRAVYGQPPTRYHRELRLGRAAEQLAHGVASATAIAERFGFSDLGTFSRAFKRRYQSAPSCFRASPCGEGRDGAAPAAGQRSMSPRMVASTTA